MQVPHPKSKPNPHSNPPNSNLNPIPDNPNPNALLIKSIFHLKYEVTTYKYQFHIRTVIIAYNNYTNLTNHTS